MRGLLFISFFSLLIACGEDTLPLIQEELPSFSMDPLTIVEGNQNKSVFISLRLSKISESTVVATLKTIDNSAVAGEDFIGIDNEQIEFTPGDVQSNIKIEIIGDDFFEQDEDFILMVAQISGAKLGTTDVVIVIENDDLNAEVIIPDSGYSTPTEYAGMELIWSDEFSESELNETFWTYEIGNGYNGWGNNELQFYRRENTFIKDGNLVIQAREENFNGFSYTSSRLITKDKFEFKFGRVDIRAVLPEGKGIWPALWTLGENISSVGWPRCGEMDIMELVGHRPSTVHATVHYANSNGNRILNGSEIHLNGGKKFSQDFHVFSMVWEEDRVDFFMDDIKYHSITRNSLGVQNPYPFNNEFFFIFNVAVGGDWPGSPNSSTMFPQNMIVDYIRVFQDN